MNDNQISALIKSLEDIRSKREENFNSFMTKIKFRSKVATASDEKCSDAYIESGNTLHFFHRKSIFITYEITGPESIKAASPTSKLLGKGKSNFLAPTALLLKLIMLLNFQRTLYQFVFYSIHAK